MLTLVTGMYSTASCLDPCVRFKFFWKEIKRDTCNKTFKVESNVNQYVSNLHEYIECNICTQMIKEEVMLVAILRNHAPVCFPSQESL